VRRRWLLGIAIILNMVLFAIGVYFELHPRDRHDRWSAAGVAAVALLNSAALNVPAGRALSPRLLRRIRRISLIANCLVLTVGLLVVALETLRELEPAAVHGAVLVAPPFVTLLALRRPEG
jgi:hypothetical protein